MTQQIEKLVNRARNHDHEALGELYDRFAPLVRALCFDQTGDLQLAWDVAQEVFLCVLTDLERLKHPARFQPWVLGIARNKLADRYRRRARLERLKDQKGEAGWAPALDPGEQEQRARLRKAIRNLPEKERLAVQLFYLEGVPALDASRLLSLPLRTVYALLARARRILKRELAT